MRKLNLNLALVALLVAGGCSQIIGISDYEIDPKLDGPKASAGEGNEGGEPTAGKGGSSGTSGNGGTSGGTDGGNGGTVNMPQGGQGGEPVVEPQAGNGGQAGESAGGEGGGSNPPRVVLPYFSEEDCTQAGGIVEAGPELLQTSEAPRQYYGDFELGKADDGSPWTESSDTYAIVVDSDSGADPHKGVYFAWLAGVKAEHSYLTSEAFDVPTDAGWLTLSGYRKFQLDSAADDVMNTDYAFISLSDDSTYLNDFYDWGPDDPGETGSWSTFELSLSAEDHQGTTRYLDFVGIADDYFTDDTIDGTNYMFDDLSLKAYRCYQP